MKSRLKLTHKEAAFLKAFELNARESFSVIGQQVGISKQSARLLYERLSQTGVIRGTTVVIDTAKLGDTSFAIFGQVEGKVDTELKKIITFLNKEEAVYWIAPLGGNYDLVFSSHLKNIYDFALLQERLIGRFSATLKNCTLAIRLRVTQCSRGYLAKTGGVQSFSVGVSPGQVSLDGIDKSILTLLSNNARITTTEIADTVGVPRTTAAQRISQLERKKIIVGYSALIHANAYDYQLYHLLIECRIKDKLFLDQFRKFCFKHPNVVTIAETLGSWDFELTCEMANAAELQELIVSIRTTFSEAINKIESLILFSHFEKYQFTV